MNYAPAPEPDPELDALLAAPELDLAELSAWRVVEGIAAPAPERLTGASDPLVIVDGVRVSLSPPAAPAPEPITANPIQPIAAKAKRAAKAKAPAPPLVRDAGYFTPTDVPDWMTALRAARPATPREARAWFVPILREAWAGGSPGCMARTAAAARAYRCAVAVTSDPWAGVEAAEGAWFDAPLSSTTSRERLA